MRNEFVRVRWDQRHGGGRKTRQSESQMVAQCMFGTAVRYGRGNFPKKYARTDIEGVRMGAAVAAAAAEK